MDRWSGRVALVTGASSGIGAAIARTLVEHGMVVIGCSRNIEAIQGMSRDLASSTGSLHAVRCDLRSEDEILALFSEIQTKHGGLDVCVNNAGLAFTETGILNGKTEHWREMLDVMVMGLAICTREAVKSMKAKNVNDGHIIQIGSIVAYTHLPATDYHWYSSIKWMVRAITDCARMELRAEKSRIKVSSVHPGFTRSDFQRRMGGEAHERAIFSTQEIMSEEKIADAVMSVLATSEEVMIEDIIVSTTSGPVF